MTQEYKVRLEQLTEQIFSEILINLKDNLKEFEREYNYDISNINFQFKIDYINKGKYGSTLTTIGLVLSGLATAGFIAANWWNPAGWAVAGGWIATGIGGIVGIFSGKVKNDENKVFEEKRRKIKTDLTRQIDEKQNKIIKDCKIKIKDKLKGIKNDFVKPLQSSTSAFSLMLEKVKVTKQRIDILHRELQDKRNEL